MERIKLSVTRACGVVKPQQVSAQELASGYYVDTATGQRYYYNAATGIWYQVSGTMLIPLSVSPLAWDYQRWTGTSLGVLNVGNAIRVTASFKYLGLARSRNIRLSIFHYTKDSTPSGSMNEGAGANSTKTLTFGPYTVATLVTAQADIVIGDDCAGEDLGVYAKFTDVLTSFVYGENCTYGMYGIGTVIPAAGVFTEFKISTIAKV
jgi:hypothetical protein